jgi:RNA polymerase primary sigma factor
MYASEVYKCDILEESELRKLIKKAQGGDKKSEDKIVKSNLRFGISLAKRYARGDEKLLCDLISEANIGLIMSIYSFNFSYNNKFITYSKDWMLKMIFDYLTNSHDQIQRVNKVKTSKVKLITNTFLLEHGRVPDSLELIDILNEKYGVTIKDETDIYNIQILSLNQESNDDPDNSMDTCELEFKNQNLVSSKNSYETDIDIEYTKCLIDSAMFQLTPKEQKVIKLLFGIDEYKSFEMKEVADEMGVSSEAIRLISKKAIQKLKNTITTNNIIL